MNEEKLVYPELSYKIIGVAYKIYNILGSGHKEAYYQRAFKNELTNKGIYFEREKEIRLIYENNCIGKYILDFIVDDKIVIEFKVFNEINNTHLKQVLQYLNVVEKKLAILIYFSKRGVIYKRIVNPKFDKK